MPLTRLHAAVAGTALAVALCATTDASAAVRLERLPLPSLTGTSGSARTSGAWHRLGRVAPRGGASLAAVTWRAGDVRALRVRGVRADGTRTAWQPIDTGDAEPVKGGLRSAGPAWLGRVRAIEVDVQGTIAGARVAAIDPGPDPVPTRPALAAPTAGPGIPAPTVVTRAGWGADESLRRGSPRHAPGVRLVVVHHTQGSNGYTRAQAADVVRGIYAYHVLEMGWNDIGYNALVDRFGTIYEGRAGGLARATIGAHARGFNDGSFGVSLMGDYMKVLPPAAQTDALARLLAWRMDVAHVDPRATVRFTSGGGSGARWPAGTEVVIPTIVGHRDVNWTDCPGDRFYPLVAGLPAAVLAVPGLRVVTPVVTIDGAHVTIAAGTTAAAAWTVTITDGDAVVGKATGDGTAARLDWQAPAALAGRVDELGWTITARGADGEARPAVGRLDGSAPGEPPPPPSAPVGSLVAEPDAIEGDGGTIEVRWLQGVAARIAVVVDDAAGRRVAVLRRWRDVSTGPQVAVWDGRDGTGRAASGVYTVRVLVDGPRADAGGAVDVAVRREVRDLSATPLVSPNGDGRADRLQLHFERLLPGTVSAALWRGDRIAWRVYGRLRQAAGVFDGSFRVPRGLEGGFTLRLAAPGKGGTQLLEQPVRVDRTPPSVRLSRVLPTGSRRYRYLRLRASEHVVFEIRTRRGALVRRGGLVTGLQNVSVRASALRAGVRVYAWDDAGIRARTLRVRIG